ncbi:pilin, partial [Patescibacteria group bacterium]|nr:pilin [Patescibacteria group bacterium]
SQDYDCACVGGNGCCAPGCDFTTDSDCPPPRPCSPIQCDQICQPNCNVSQDSDCGCLGGNGCCAPGCTIANDSDCPPVPTQYDNPLTWSDVPELLQQTIETIFGMLMALAVLIIIIGGYVMVTSGGIPLRFDKGKKIVIWALIGFAVSAVSRGIIALVEMIIGKQ